MSSSISNVSLTNSTRSGHDADWLQYDTLQLTFRLNDPVHVITDPPTIDIQFQLNGSNVGNISVNQTLYDDQTTFIDYTYDIYAQDPLDPGTSNRRVRISATDDVNTQTSDINGSFAGYLFVSPTSSTIWIEENSFNVEVTEIGVTETVTLSLSIDNGSSYPYTLANSADAASPINIYVPASTFTSQAKVKIQNETYSYAINESDSFIIGSSGVGGVDCFIEGCITSSGSIPLYCCGAIVSSSSIPLYCEAPSSAESSGNIPLYIFSSVGVSGNIPLYTYGHSTSSNSIPLHIANGVASGCSLYTYGHALSSGNISLFCKAYDTPHSGQIPLYNYGHLTVSGVTPLYIYGYDTYDAGLNLFVKAFDPSTYNNSIPLFMQVGGYIDESGNPVYSSSYSKGIPLYIAGTGDKSASMNLFIRGPDEYSVAHSGYMNLYLHSETPRIESYIPLYIKQDTLEASSGIPLFIYSAPLFPDPDDPEAPSSEGFYPSSANMNMYIHCPGYANSIPMFLRGPADVYNSGISMFIQGAYLYNSGIPLSIPNTVATNSQYITLYTHGFYNSFGGG